MFEIGERHGGRGAAGDERRGASGEMFEIGERHGGRGAAGGERRGASGEMFEIGERRRGRGAAGDERRGASGEMFEIGDRRRGRGAAGDERRGGHNMTLLRALRGYAFTIAGIAIGVAGLVALGAMGERIVRFIEGGDRFVLGQISVAGRGMGMGAGFTAGGLLPASALEAIAGVPGVAGVQAQVMLPLNPSTSQFMTLTQELIVGMDVSVPTPNRHYRSLPVRSGRFLRPEDRHVAVVGASFAAARGLDVGSRLPLEGADYEIVGVLDRMMTAPDRFVIVPIADAREQWVAKDPMLRTVLASGAIPLRAQDLNTGAAVGWRDGEDPDIVAARIKERVPGVNVQMPSELSRLLRSSTAFFSALLVGIAVLALVIGGLSLANTITAAVFERIRDFGVKRALGATDAQLGREVLGEALAVTLAGGAGGIALAALLGTGVDAWLTGSGQELFLFSPRLVGGAVVFSILLGGAAALYATFRIVRLSPAEAIRRGA
jgi:putative ABC transport system permease protein